MMLATFAFSASAIGLSLVLLSVPSLRGAEANSVANAACTARTTAALRVGTFTPTLRVVRRTPMPRAKQSAASAHPHAKHSGL